MNTNLEHNKNHGTVYKKTSGSYLVHSEGRVVDCGGAVVDTPGMREFGLWNGDATDPAMFFPEIRPDVGRCKFGLECRHMEEPVCAILKAVKTGRIDERRYKSFIRIRAGD
jgi:ribosome biogenesis GTPase / thiamine phosphate phosphatase